MPIKSFLSPVLSWASLHCPCFCLVFSLIVILLLPLMMIKLIDLSTILAVPNTCMCNPICDILFQSIHEALTHVLLHGCYNFALYRASLFRSSLPVFHNQILYFQFFFEQYSFGVSSIKQLTKITNRTDEAQIGSRELLRLDFSIGYIC